MRQKDNSEGLYHRSEDSSKQNSSFSVRPKQKTVSAHSLAATPTPPGVHVAVIGYLAHHIVNEEAIGSPPGSGDSRKHIDHQGFFVLGRLTPMFSQNRHRGVAGVAIEDGELKRVGKLAVTLSVITQFAQIALIHARLSAPK